MQAERATYEIVNTSISSSIASSEQVDAAIVRAKGETTSREYGPETFAKVSEIMAEVDGEGLDKEA